MLKKQAALLITINYLVFGVLWIVLTDLIVDRYLDNFFYYSIIKGIIFVGLSAIIVYYAVFYQLQKQYKLQAELDEHVKRAKLYKEAVKDQEKQLIDIVKKSPLPAVLHRQNGQIIAFSHNQTAITGLGLKETASVQAFVERIGKENTDTFFQYVNALYENPEQPLISSFTIKDKTNHEIKLKVHSAFIGYDQKGMANYLSIATDLTEQEKTESHLRYLTEHDDLTGLYNKRYFNRYVENPENQRYGLILIDINSLKLINDVYGHAQGDALLKLFTKVMKEHVLKEDILCRLGGDEFAVITANTNQKTLNDLTMRIQNALLDNDFLDVKTTASFGVSIKTKDRSFYQTFVEVEHNLYSHKTHLLNQQNNLVLKSLMKSLFASSDETNDHLDQLNALAQPLADRLKLSEEERNNLTLLIKIHDIGKINVPNKIFSITQTLSEEDFQEIKKHPEYGYRIANALPQLKTVAYAVLTHHENVDGSGYPFGLKEQEIPYLARILRILDSYETMVSGRLYQKKKTAQEAIQELEKYAGIYYDKTLVSRFVESLGLAK